MATLPTPAAVRRAILDAIAAYNVRPGEIFPVMGVNMKLQKRGFRAEEIAAEFDRMAQDGLIEESGSPAHLKITAAGFAAI